MIDERSQMVFDILLAIQSDVRAVKFALLEMGECMNRLEAVFDKFEHSGGTDSHHA